MEIRRFMKPGVMLSNIWPQSRQTEGATVTALEKAINLNFFEAIQIVDIPFPSERLRFSELLREHRLPCNMAMTRVLNLNGLNLSTADPELRQRSVNLICRELDHAREAGMTRCTLVSGPRPHTESERKECLRYFTDSMDRICTAAEEEPAVEILIEPLDYFAHKRMTLGTVHEAVEIAETLRPNHPRFGLCIDTAHMSLNEEEYLPAMEEAKPFLTEFHFCNPCKKKGDPLYGDRHLLLGEPGELDRSDVVDLMLKGIEKNIFTEEHRLTVAFEILSSEKMAGLDLLKHCRDLFVDCWEQVEDRLDSG